MRRRTPEMLFHKAVAAYLNAALPSSVWWTTIPAGGGGLVRGAHLKAMGYRAGTPDILICHKGKAYWIELKAPKGKPSSEQSNVFDILHFTIGTPVGTARCLEDIEGYLRVWGIPNVAKMRRAA